MIILITCTFLAGAMGQCKASSAGFVPDTAMQGVIPASLAIGGVESALHADHILHMDFKRLLATITGVTIAVTGFEMLIGGGTEVRFIAILAGGLLGDYWYRKNFWPFHRRQTSWWWPW